MLLRCMSWWHLKQCYSRTDNTLACKARADIVVVHPVSWFAVVKTGEQCCDTSLWTLLAYCNHGKACAKTFTDLDNLKSLMPERLEELVCAFV